jgi:hypothetical protein
MAKAKKVAVEKPHTAAPKIVNLFVPLQTQAANIQVTFSDGIGHLTIVHRRKGKTEAEVFITKSTRVTLNDVQKRDAIGLDGVCAGSALIAIDVKTKLPTPKVYHGDIIDGFIVA